MTTEDDPTVVIPESVVPVIAANETPVNDPLASFLELVPLADDPVPYIQFLRELKDHPERADTAYANISRCIMEMGYEDPEKEPDPERQQYLRMLKERGILSLNAFLHATGTQKFSARSLAFWGNGARNGVQLKQMLIVEGGPGSGKDFWGDGIIEALETHGKVYAVKGCPDHENPINLLRLLSKDQRAELAKELGLGARLEELVELALDPCQVCYNNVMGDIDNPNKAPNLSTVQVEALRLSRRTVGVAEWKPGQSCSLVGALRQSNRGFIRLPDAFVRRDPRPGETDERLVLLDATQYRRLPGTATQCGSASSASPLDAFILTTTNSGALKTFLDGLQDKSAFTRRAHIERFPYPTARVEEARAYRREIARLSETVHFDPLVLKIIATVACLSRLEALTGGVQVHPIDRLRLGDGESYVVKPNKSAWEKHYPSQGSSSSSDNWGGSKSSSSSYGGYGGSSSSSKPAASAVSFDSVGIDDIWKMESPEQGMRGLNVPYMLGVLSSINAFALYNIPEKCVSSLDALWLMRVLITRRLKAGSNLTDDEKEVLRRCEQWLGGKPSSDTLETKGAQAFGSDIGDSEPGLIESEYRRLLKNQLMRVFAPDYEQRAQQIYEHYKLHGQAAFLGETDTVQDPKLGGKVLIDHASIDELDCYIAGKPWRKKNKGTGKPSLTAEDKQFRNPAKIEALLLEAREEFIAQHGQDHAREFKESWQTIPEIADAIRKTLDDEIGGLMEKTMSTEVSTNLTEDEQHRLKIAREELSKLGYCQHCLKPVLEYAKRVKVWAHKG
jgi:predicted Ser/Thr protein kinase